MNKNLYWNLLSETCVSFSHHLKIVSANFCLLCLLLQQMQIHARLQLQNSPGQSTHSFFFYLLLLTFPFFLPFVFHLSPFLPSFCMACKYTEYTVCYDLFSIYLNPSSRTYTRYICSKGQASVSQIKGGLVVFVHFMSGVYCQFIKCL